MKVQEKRKEIGMPTGSSLLAVGRATFCTGNSSEE